MPKTLLLADDSVTIQKVVAISFASEDVEVIAVDNGDDAIARIREALPDVVLADAVMPGKNGYEVCEAVKGDAALAHIPVLLLTGTFEAFDEARAQQVGAVGHIAKPFEAQALVDEVRRLFSAAPAPVPAADGPISEPEVVAERVEDAAAASANAFDFFDDEPDQQAVATPETAIEDPTSEPEFETPDTAFNFVQEDLAAQEAVVSESFEDQLIDASEAAEGSIPVALDADPVLESVEVMDGDALAAGSAMDAELDELSIEAGTATLENDDIAEESLVSDASTSAEQPFDFAVEAAAATPMDSGSPQDGTDPVLPDDDLAQETIIDPHGASGYDVSSSDLDAGATDESPADTGDAIADTADAIQAFAEPDATILAPLLESNEPPHGDLQEPAEAVEETVAVAVEDDSPSEPAEVFQAAPVAPAEIEAESIAVEESAPPAASMSADSMLQNIEPELRQQLHDTLEKIAWESFGELTEAIVRQSVERVEAIAWEVLPQMAETLIREEIRRLKGEPGDA